MRERWRQPLRRQKGLGIGSYPPRQTRPRPGEQVRQHISEIIRGVVVAVLVWALGWITFGLCGVKVDRWPQPGEAPPVHRTAPEERNRQQELKVWLVDRQDNI